MSLGFAPVILAAPGGGFIPAPTPLMIVSIIRWLGGSRRTGELVPGVSFPGYDAQGNPLDWEDVYQFADLFTPDGEPVEDLPPEFVLPPLEPNSTATPHGDYWRAPTTSGGPDLGILLALGVLVWLAS